MVNLGFQFICAALFAIGLLFILIDFRTKYDRSFRFFGASLLFLCAMCAIDIWIMPMVKQPEEALAWQRLFHVMACLFIPFSLWYLLILAKSPLLRHAQVLFPACFVVSLSFFSEWSLSDRGGDVHAGALYYALFIPYVLCYVGLANTLILRRLKVAPESERRILRFHLLGFVVLFACGIADILTVALSIMHTTSFTSLGVLGFGSMASMIFAERFMLILRERQASFEKLESAYRDLEQVNALKQIGESTAIINHEIKNYMFMISGNAQILAEVEQLSLKGKDIVKNIVSSVERLTVFSDDILKLSRTHVIREKHPINITELIKGSIDKHYPERRASFTLSGMERDHFLFGDWGKLEQVFVNLFNNAFEAGQGKPVGIHVKITDAQSLLLVSVEDDGEGCTPEQMASLFRAFYTTKKSQGGTGLGMSISRTIVESHGGKISAYSKNIGRGGDHGLKLIMTFPVYAQNLADEAHRKHPIVMIKEGMETLPDMIRVFQNVRVSPCIIQGVDELDAIEFPPDQVTILVSAKTLASSFAALSAYRRLCLVSHHQGNLYVLDHGRGNRPEVFSEEYVVSKLVRRATPRIRHRERQTNLAA